MTCQQTNLDIDGGTLPATQTAAKDCRESRSLSRPLPASFPVNCLRWEGLNPSGPAADAVFIDCMAASIILRSMINGCAVVKSVGSVSFEIGGCFSLRAVSVASVGASSFPSSMISFIALLTWPASIRLRKARLNVFAF